MGDRPPSSITRTRQNVLARQQPQENLFDTHPEVSLDFEIVRRAARHKYTQPFLILDTAIVRSKVRRFRAAMPRVRPHYAVKANPDRRVLKVLAQEGTGFEIASTAELDLLLSLGVNATDVLYSNPVKSRESIAYAAAQVVNEGLKAFPEEVQVIAEPGRYLVSDAGYFVCRVLGTATRAGKRWMHWDAGLFGGVIESSEGLKYRIRTERSGPDIPWTVA